MGSQTKPAAPKLGEQILKVVVACSDRKGVSLGSRKKALVQSSLDVEKLCSQIRFSFRRNVEKGSLVQSKGQSASGSFQTTKKETQGKMGKKVKKPAGKKSLMKKPADKKHLMKKPAAKQHLVKKPAAKKHLIKKPAAKKPAAKKH
ncbi:histone H1-like [Heterodontus francisci]|uniref:histone H1-like n=1 Tax=Heterodontus francisci TaxID=7792 RepID=UPI00355B0FF0